MTDIEFGYFTIPQIPTNNTFKGSFSIENDVILGYQLDEIARFMYLLDRDLIRQLLLDDQTS